MVDLTRKPAAVLATAAIVLLLCGTLCLFADGGAGMGLCVLVLAVASVALVTLALEPAGQLVPVRAGVASLAPADLRAPPPKR
ncbi:MAG: hypothetical protein A3D33_21600 [Candidatus Rokubacteria bacterium RIFCSPHIGHO2_02_FULL_73_26]|nr:MAG: hypothetical protein A3D33_21600 [Candidatus Rokubacteria bacterium RIFCSPHIGHO2_02_FULL_73_26]